jgi:Tfp pilus assembly protein PilO
MKSSLVNYLQKNVQPQMLVFLLVSLLILTMAAGYLYILKKPFADFRQSQQALALLENELQTGLTLNSIIASTQQNISQLDKKLNGSSPSLPVNQLIAFVIGELDSIAIKHQIKLISVKPESIENKLFFHELPFVIEISGSYLNL